MADTAAHLVDRVMPAVPVRQWVLSLPYALRFRVAFDSSLLGQVLDVFLCAVFASLRKRARDYGIPGGQCGAVTFIQRFGSDLRLNPHFHAMIFDGVYAAKPGERPRFYPLRAPDVSAVSAVVDRVARRVALLLDGPEEHEADPAARMPMAELCAASIRGIQTTGPGAGQRMQTAAPGAMEAMQTEESFLGGSPRCAMTAGFSVHAGVGLRADDRKGLERLLRYAARPPVAVDRLEALPDGRLSYRLKTPWRNGTTHVIFEPLELLARLAALVPAPRVNLVRYHGVLGPAAHWRAAIVPAPPEALDAENCGHDENSNQHGRSRRRNYSWAVLMARVFEIDVLRCLRCNGRLKIVAAIHPPDTTRQILDCMGLSGRAPPLARASSETISDVQ